MANNLLGGLGGLGGLMKGLSGFMPQDDPNVKLMNAQNEVSELEAKETEAYAQIGKQAVKADGLERFGELADRLRLIQSNLALARGTLESVQLEKAAGEKAVQEAEQRLICPACGMRNTDGMKFCQGCGAKLGADSKPVCASCGAELVPGVRFCGECGQRIP